MSYDLKHSGKMQEFSTGAHRDSREGKWRLDLIDPAFELAIAAVMAEGAKPPPEGYGENNWQKGMPYSVLYASMRRHLMAWWLGKDDEDHLAHLACNIMFAINYRDRLYWDLDQKGDLSSELDDRPLEKNLEVPLTSGKKPSILECWFCGGHLDAAATRCRGCGKGRSDEKC